MDYPDIVRQLAATRGSALRREILGEMADWGPHEENTALLVDAQSYWLDWEWGRRTIDPNDPKIARERAEARRRGIKPPPHPLIPPVAARPNSLAEQRITEYIERVTASMEPAAPVLRAVSIDEFNQFIQAM